jgi:hypothetical protein
MNSPEKRQLLLLIIACLMVWSIIQIDSGNQQTQTITDSTISFDRDESKDNYPIRTHENIKAEVIQEYDDELSTLREQNQNSLDNF